MIINTLNHLYLHTEYEQVIKILQTLSNSSVKKYTDAFHFAVHDTPAGNSLDCRPTFSFVVVPCGACVPNRNSAKVSRGSVCVMCAVHVQNRHLHVQNCGLVSTQNFHV